ncbi:hypothetical protein [Bacillus changyiensis]
MAKRAGVTIRTLKYYENRVTE